MSNDNGLVDELDKIETLKKQIELKEAELKNKIIELAKQMNTEVLFGTHKKCTIKPYDKVIYPEDKTKLSDLIKSKGMYDDLSMLNYSRISSRFGKKELPVDIISLIKIQKDFRVSLIDRGV